MKTFVNFISFLLILSILSCLTPESALERKQYKTALRLSAQKIKKGEDVENNIRILQTAADYIVANELEKRKHWVNSDKVKDWIKAQDSYYRTLEVIGKANIESDGAVIHTYDDLCTKKKELDFKIVDYYYQRGEKYLDKFYEQGQKVEARNAYFEYIKAKKHGAHIYYLDIDEKINESYQNGIVYYIGDKYEVGSSLFLKPLPKNATFEPDCKIRVDYGTINYSESTSETSKTYTEEVVVGQKMVKDTSGKVEYIDVLEEVTATVITTEVTITASTTTYIYSTDLTGQCTVSSESFTNEVSDSYETINIQGDARAVSSSISEKSAPSFFKSKLEDALKEKVERNLSFHF